MTNSTDSNSKEKTAKNVNGSSEYANEIKSTSIILGGVFFVALFVVNFMMIVVCWPNKTPDARQNLEPLYVYHKWGMHLMDSTYIREQERKKKAKESVLPAVAVAKDTVNKPANDTLDKKATDVSSQGDHSVSQGPSKKKQRIFHFNTILLILVLLGGFLGNLIHIATSFTAYVGLRKFKKSWLLWYYVKPFIAAALALTVYFVFRGGFLSGDNDIFSVNPYAIVSMALLTGLFTDVVTDKLKKILDVIFPGAKGTLDSTDESLIKGISTTDVIRGVATEIVIFGENVENFKKVTISINDKEVNFDQEDDHFSLSYTHADNDPAKEVLIEVKVDKKVIHTFKLMVREG